MSQWGLRDSEGPTRSQSPAHGPQAALLASLSAGILAITVVGLTLRLDQLNLHLPLNYLRDANIFLLRAKSIVEGNWVWSNPRLGLPFGADFRDFPMNITMDSGVMWLLSRFTSSAPLIVNLEWIIAIGLCAALACFALMRLGFRRVAAAALGAIFALLPYIYFRGTQHLHSVYYAVPLIALASIELIRGAWSAGDDATRWWNWPAKIPVYAWIGCLIAGLAYVYTAFFALLILLLGGFFGSLRLRSLRPLAPAAILSGLLVAVVAIDLSPSLLFWARNGRNASMLFKSPAETELYGMKIRYLITPTPDHPIAAFRAAESRLAESKYPLFANENEWGRLGTIGSVGFLSLVIFALGAAVSPRFAQSPMSSTLGPASALTLSCILIATVGGFSDFISVFFSPEIRCYARIFPFIGFYSIVAIATLTASLDRSFKPMLRVPLWIAVVILAGFDQAVPSYANDHHQAIYRQDDDFVRYIESELPSESAIFELPFTDFPNEILPASLKTNDLLRPYLHSEKYRWSWPAVSGTMPAEWNRLVAGSPPRDMLRSIVHRGFSGLWVDTAGFAAGSSPEAALSAEIAATPKRSADGRILFYDLRQYASSLEREERLLSRDALAARYPIQVLYERGFYYEERDGQHAWRWSLRDGRMTIVNPIPIPRSASIRLSIQSADGHAHRLVITGVGQTDQTVSTGSYARTVNLAGMQIVSLDLECDCPEVVPKNSPRRLAFSVADVYVQDGGTSRSTP